ncbi:hypothetical protein [Vibrio owensii]|uniref:hypothetical protein n=1 Tax=Vibrio owensii TaxID=696485 RepID=UPI004067A690
MILSDDLSTDEKLVNEIHDYMFSTIVKLQQLARNYPDHARMMFACNEEDVIAFANLRVEDLTQVRDLSKTLPLSFPAIRRGNKHMSSLPLFIEAVEKGTFAKYDKFVNTERSLLMGATLRGENENASRI